MNEALLWTDGRYFLQGALELSDQWKLMRMGGDPAVDIRMADVSNLTEPLRGVEKKISTLSRKHHCISKVSIRFLSASLLPPLKRKISKQQNPIQHRHAPSLRTRTRKVKFPLLQFKRRCSSFGDYHQSEYVSDRDKRREFVFGFTRSAGCLAPSYIILLITVRFGTYFNE